MSKLTELKALAENESIDTREWSWCNHRETILKLIEVVELQSKALDHYCFMGEFDSFYVSNDGHDIASSASAKCNKLLEEL